MQRDPALEYLNRRTNALDRRAYLKAMGSGEIIDVATRAYQRLGRTILKQTAFPMLLCFSVLVFFFVFLGPAFFETSSPDNLTTQLAEAFGVLVVGCVFAVPLFFLGMAYAQGFVTRLVADFVLGNVADERSALEGARRGLKTMVGVCVRVFFAAFGTAIVGGLLLGLSALATDRTSGDNAWPAVVTVIATILLIASPIMPIIAIARYSLAPVAVVLEGCPVKVGIQRGKDLIKHRAFQTGAGDTIAAVLLLCVFLFLCIWGGTAVGFGLLGIAEHARNWLGSGPLGTIVQAVITMLPVYFALWVVSPVWCATCTLLYFDRRIRLEGYDIFVLEQDVRRASRKSRFQY